ncbi:hypothetical protein [Sphingomonas sp. M1-B02]|uniref:hypothetical protein n=1 Tax=Sphingomonas sp. M1-B02 TaxID=3114300 RepID=UPI00223F3F9F|nr:hypothetical protein [Sphingomonas sp. S6-11]UZK65124.1 hypothetical protein OKW87_11425 [Sphingomonas sp. S6-11]
MPAALSSLKERLREKGGRRGAAFLLALLVELLLALLLLFLAPPIAGVDKGPIPTTFAIDTSGDSETAEKAPEKARERSESPSEPRPTPPKPVEPPPPAEEPPVPPPTLPSNFIHLTRPEFKAADITGKGTAPSAAPAGEALAGAASGGSPGDTAVVGRAPNGEPLYAAAWYRRPRDVELQPYISKRARGPGWGIIACRMVPSYRVEDCQELSESPRGSGYAGSVRQAAWQFRVRPPRVGGTEKYGTWVSIRITYGDVGDE